jgi:eukaryotic-like serine/threonine-protein kinase
MGRGLGELAKQHDDSVKPDEQTSGATVDERGGAKSGESSAGKLSRGTNLGRYVLLDPVGEGGLGVVYAAYDPELDRKVAVKLLRPRASRSATATEGKTRLLREAQAMARLSHPNVVAVHDVGVHEDQVFVAMDLIEGDTLKKWMVVRKRTSREVLQMFLQAGHGLAAAHAANLVHRDFKPDNVLIDKNGRALVTDFGLARAAGSSGDAMEIPVSPEAGTELGHESGPLATPLTAAGIVMGTPGYVAPEQLRGEPADALSDQFSFCVSLYEALYGERPFAGNTLDSYAGAIEQSGAHPRPPTGRVPARLRKILLKGMSLKPADRFASDDSLLKELSKDPARTTRRILLGAGALLVFAAALLGVRQYRLHRLLECEDSVGQFAGTWDAEVKAKMHGAFTATGKPFAEDAWSGVSRTLDAYTASWASTRDEACKATRIHHAQSEESLLLQMACLERERTALKALVDVLGSADGSVVENSVIATQSLDSPKACANFAALRREPTLIPADPEGVVRVAKLRARLAEANALFDASQYAKAVQVATTLAADCDETGDRSLKAEALLILGRAIARSGEDDRKAEQTLTRAYLSATSTRNGIVAARAASNKIGVLARIGDHAEAEFWSDLAQALIDGLGGDDELQADQFLGRSLNYFYKGEYSQAEAEATKAFEIQKRLFGLEDSRTTRALYFRANSVANQNTRWREALDLYQQLVEITERVLGPTHPQLVGYLGDYAEALDALGMSRDGYQIGKRALSIATTSSGPASIEVAAVLGVLARSARYVGEGDRALLYAKRAVAIFEGKPRADAYNMVGCLDELGLALLAKGRSEEALAAFKRSMAIREEARGRDDVALQDALDGAGKAYLGLRQPKQAIPLLERAVRLRQKAWAEPGQLGSTLFALARARSEAKDNPKFARDLALQAREDLAKYPWYASTVKEVDFWLKIHPAR